MLISRSVNQYVGVISVIQTDFFRSQFSVIWKGVYPSCEGHVEIVQRPRY